MADADLVITGTVLTVDEARPADPRAVPAEKIADLDIRATFLAARQVFAQ